MTGVNGSFAVNGCYLLEYIVREQRSRVENPLCSFSKELFVWLICINELKRPFIIWYYNLGIMIPFVSYHVCCVESELDVDV